MVIMKRATKTIVVSCVIKINAVAVINNVMIIVTDMHMDLLYFDLSWSYNLFSLLHRRYNERDGVPNHQPLDCLLNHLFRRRSKKTSKLRVTGLCAGNSPVTGEFPTQRASNAENVSIWWRHHVDSFDRLSHVLFGCFTDTGQSHHFLGASELTYNLNIYLKT